MIFIHRIMVTEKENGKSIGVKEHVQGPETTYELVINDDRDTETSLITISRNQLELLSTIINSMVRGNNYYFTSEDCVSSDSRFLKHLQSGVTMDDIATNSKDTTNGN